MFNAISCSDNFEAYFVQRRGLKTCSNASMILDKIECTRACNELGGTLTNNLKNGKPCYRAGNGKCRQNNGHGLGASLICKNKGKWLSHH